MFSEPVLDKVPPDWMKTLVDATPAIDRLPPSMVMLSKTGVCAPN